MARKLYEKQAVRRRNGQLATGVALVVYTDAAGTVPADVSLTLGGSAIAGSTVTTADIAGLGPASLRFYGPTDGTDILYMRTPDDVSLGVQKIEADPDPRLDLLEAGVTSGLAAHEADTTVIHGIADTTKLSIKPASTDQVRYASKSGNNSNDGLSWGTAKLTIQAAHDSISGHGGTVYVGKGSYTETVTITKNDITIEGQGVHPANGTAIVPPASNAYGFVIDGVGAGLGTLSDVVLKNLLVHTDSYPTFSGGGFWLHHVARCQIIHCLYYGVISTGTASATVGGTGLRMEWCEGNYVESLYVAGASKGIDLVDEASSNTFVNAKADTCYQELLISGLSGGNVFHHMKSVFSTSATPFVVDIGQAQNTFIACDWSESLSARKVRIAGDQNIFIHGACSPQTTVYVSGNRNEFDGYRVQKWVEVSAGAVGNIFRNVRVNASCTLDNLGDQTVIDRPWNEGTINYGTALSAKLESPHMRSGYYYGTGPAAPAQNAINQDYLYASPLYVPFPVTLDRLGLFVGVVGSAGSVVRLGIYLDNGRGWPGTLLLDAGTVATASGTGEKTITISQAVGPGLIWLAGVAQVAAPPQPYGNGIQPALFASTSLTAMALPNTFVASGVTGALPGTYGTPLSDNTGGIRVLARVA